MLASVLPGSAALAHEEDSYTFTGSGWGHSIGMSQYGAFGQALAGATGEEIVGYYYAGVAVETTDELTVAGDIDSEHPLVTDPTPVWVGIRQNVSSFTLEPVGGPFEVCQDVDGESICATVGWTDEEPEVWQVSSVEENGEAGCIVDRLDPAPGEGEVPPLGFGNCSITIAWGEEGHAQRVSVDGDVCTDAGTVGRECFGRGTLQVRSDQVTDGFHISLEIGVDDYMYGLGEMPSSWPDAALEAQALAGRSYLVRRVLVHDKPELATGGDPGLSTTRKGDCWCHLYSSSLDQNYVGHAKEADSEHSPDWIAAVDATASMVITHDASVPKIISAFYHSSSGGHTEDNVAVWGTAALPYLVPVSDPWSNDEAVSNPFAEWTLTVSAADLASQLGWDEVTHVSQLTGAPDAQFEMRGTLDSEVVVETHNSGWLYYALGARSPHFESVYVERYQPFLDMDGTGHGDSIYAIWEAGISDGCGDDYYCPDELVTRAQMATFLARALGLENISEGRFTDIGHTGIHAGAINAVADAGISLGCGDDVFCPDQVVTRAQMASFLARAADLAPVGSGPFTDLDGVGTHAGAINAVAAAGISLGCGDGVFCPDQVVTRAQMASFLARAFLWSDPGPPAE